MPERVILERKDLIKILEAIDYMKLDSPSIWALTKLYEDVFGINITSNIPRAEREKTGIITVTNLNDYKSTLLWSGKKDVRLQVEEYFQSEDSEYADFIEKMSEEEIENLVSSVTNQIDWESDIFISAERGNEHINEKIQNKLDAMIKEGK